MAVEDILIETKLGVEFRLRGSGLKPDDFLRFMIRLSDSGMISPHYSVAANALMESGLLEGEYPSWIITPIPSLPGK